MNLTSSLSAAGKGQLNLYSMGQGKDRGAKNLKGREFPKKKENNCFSPFPLEK